MCYIQPSSAAAERCFNILKRIVDVIGVLALEKTVYARMCVQINYWWKGQIMDIDT